MEEERAFWAWAIVEVLRHTGMRIEEALELTHHSFVAYQLPTTGEIVPMLQVAPSKLYQERLLLVSPELGEVLTAIIHRVRRGQQAMPLVSAYDSLERLWSAPMPFLFQRRRSLRPGEEYREPTAQEWQDFLAHFELRKVALSVCARDFGTPCVHEHACLSEPVQLDAELVREVASPRKVVVK